MESALLITTGKAQIPFHDELMKWRVMSDPQEVVFYGQCKIGSFQSPFGPLSSLIWLRGDWEIYGHGAEKKLIGL